MADINSRRLLYKIAKAYYEDGLSQKQIGLRLGLSRINVSRKLKQARDLKIVQIILSPGNPLNDQLEHEIEKKYGVNEAIVISTDEMDGQQEILRALGVAAAECLTRSIQGEETLAVTWGRTVLAIVDALPQRNWPNLRVVQSLGGLSQPDSRINGVDLSRRIAQTFNAKLFFLSSPGVVESKAVRDALLQDPQIKQTLAVAAKAQLAVMGIGVPDPASSISRFDILDQKELDELIAKGAVGEIGLQFFNADGEPIDTGIRERVVGLELSQYKAIPRVIAVAAGMEKVAAIKAVLKTKIIKVLVTDDATAKALLD